MYSNCLFEAIKAKIKDPKIKFFKVPYPISTTNHYMWFDGKNYFHSVAYKPTWYNHFWHKQFIKKVDEISFNHFVLDGLKFKNIRRKKFLVKKMCLRIGNYNSEWESSWEEDNHSDLPKQEDIDFFEKVVKAKAVFKVSTKEKGLQLMNYNELLALKGNFRWKWIGLYDQDFERTYLNMSDLKWKDINY